jgi:hypothetical protein
MSGLCSVVLANMPYIEWQDTAYERMNVPTFEVMLIPVTPHVSFANGSGTLLITDFRMLFSSSGEPSTASMVACLPLIFEFIQESVDHSFSCSRR